MSSVSLGIQIAQNQHFNGQLSPLFTKEEAYKASAFHSKVEGYQPTPLCSLSSLATEIGVGKILIKDEAHRFDLSAFKMLGGAYAVARLLCAEYGFNIDEFDFDKVKHEISEKMTFATATDGNHGRGIAWAANKLGQNAVIYMPKGAAIDRVENIKSLGAECIVTDLNYDDTVRLAIKTANENGWKIVQDTAWEGYQEIPTWIMQGYATLAVEAVQQMKDMGVERPTHVFLQAGVGAMAGGVLGYLCHEFGSESLQSVIIEPDLADCIYRSGISDAGEMVNVEGDLATIMVGLACGEPNPIGWPVLRDNATQFISCQDSVAALGMRVLGNPLNDDPRVISGESGAVGAGLLAAIHLHPEKQTLMQELNLDEESVILLINTEGDTDPVHYREVVWQGKHPTV